jgi:hypothetical protein
MASADGAAGCSAHASAFGLPAATHAAICSPRSRTSLGSEMR